MTAAELNAIQPFLQGQSFVPKECLYQRNWRYLIEVNSACNLRCIMCMAGNRSGYEYHPGIMSLDLMDKILDKVQSENPRAIVMPYGNSEPFLHPTYHKVVAAIKQHGLGCEVASNFHFTKNLAEVVEANPDVFIISTSGFTQPVYSRAHRGGDIETVKENMKTLSGLRKGLNPKLNVIVDYHRYRYNLHEIAPMQEYAQSLGFGFMSVSGRMISMENAVQCLRHLDCQAGEPVPPFSTNNGLDLNQVLPPVNPEWLQNIEHLEFHPSGISQLYAQYPVASVCIISDLFTYIRYDGTVTLCAWVDDRRFNLGNYLEMTPQQISRARLGHPFCQECLRYKLNLYFQLLDADKWSPIQTPKTK